MGITELYTSLVQGGGGDFELSGQAGRDDRHARQQVLIRYHAKTNRFIIILPSSFKDTDRR